jgi:hypothetical protein
MAHPIDAKNHIAKVRVAGSIPLVRSKKLGSSQSPVNGGAKGRCFSLSVRERVARTTFLGLIGFFGRRQVLSASSLDSCDADHVTRCSVRSSIGGFRIRSTALDREGKVLVRVGPRLPSLR